MDGSFIFLSIFNWCHSLRFLKYKWALWLEILRGRGSYVNRETSPDCPAGFGVAEEWWRTESFHGWQPASLKPVYFCSIHGHFPAVSVTTNLTGRSVSFMTNVLILARTHNSLLRSLTTTSVFRHHDPQGLNLPFLLLGYKTLPGRGERGM